MLDFHTPSLNDKAWVDEVLTGSQHMNCVYSFAQMYLWAIHYGTRICRYKKCLLAISGHDSRRYIYPAGEYDITEIVDVLQKDAAGCGTKLEFCVAEAWQADELDKAFPGRFCRESFRDDFDYIYNAEDLINLSGRKYHGKRNHIAKFDRSHPGWRYEPITADNTDDCLEANDEWYSGQEKLSEGLAHEQQIIRKALLEREILGLSGGLIRIDGKVVAFTLGEPLSDETFVVHYEKALPGFEGAYPVINNQFAKHVMTGFRYVNREEDLGIEGLRKAKLSYYPAILLEKFSLTER